MKQYYKECKNTKEVNKYLKKINAEGGGKTAFYNTLKCKRLQKGSIYL